MHGILNCQFLLKAQECLQIKLPLKKAPDAEAHLHGINAGIRHAQSGVRDVQIA